MTESSETGNPESPKPGSGGRQRRQRTEYRSDGAAASRGLRWIVLPVVGLVVVGLATALLAKPAYRKYKEGKGRAAGVRAGEQFAAGEMADAVRTLRLGLQLAPEDTVVLRNAAQILATEDIPDALNFWQKIFHKGEGTIDDRIRYSTLAIRLRRFGLAKQELDELLKAEPKNPTIQQLAIQLAQATGNWSEAIAWVRQLAVNENNETGKYHLGRCLVQASKPEAGKEANPQQVKWAEEGSQILLPIASTAGPLQSGAASALADSVILQGEAARMVLDSLAKITNKTEADVLSMAVIQAKADPKKARDSAQMIVRELANSPVDSRMRAADWLSNMGLANLAAQLIRPADTTTNVLAAYMDADLALKSRNWPHLKEVLSQTNIVLTTTMSNVLSAGVSLSENNPTVAEQILRSAIDTANGTISADNELVYIANSAEQLGLTRVAIAAHEARLSRGSAVVPASEDLLRLCLLEQGRDPQFPGLLRQYPALQARHAAVPEDLSVASYFYYASVMLERNLPQAQAGLAELRQKLPDHSELLILLALAHLRLGATPEAARLIEENPVDAATLPMRMKPAMIFVLGKTGQNELARSLTQKLDLTQYFLEERELVAPWIQR